MTHFITNFSFSFFHPQFVSKKLQLQIYKKVQNIRKIYSFFFIVHCNYDCWLIVNPKCHTHSITAFFCIKNHKKPLHPKKNFKKQVTHISPVMPLLYMEDMSSNLGFLTACPAIGQPESDLCVEKEPFMCPIPSHPGVGQLTPSNFMAVAAATAALCCSTVPPDSRTRILLRFAMGQPDALE